MASSRLVFLGPLLALLFTSGAAAGRSLLASSSSSSSQSVFSLDRYGARGDGTHDDTPALAEAWEAACASSLPAPVVLVPGGKRYLIKQPVTVSGPCESSSVAVAVPGALVASPDRSDWGDDGDWRHWIVFSSASGVDQSTSNKQRNEAAAAPYRRGRTRGSCSVVHVDMSITDTPAMGLS